MTDARTKAIEALRFYRDEWRVQAAGKTIDGIEMDETGHPTQRLTDDHGQRACEALAALESAAPPPPAPAPEPGGYAGLVARLKAPANWLRQDRGQQWKDAVNEYDRAPFEAATAIEALEADLRRVTDPEYLASAIEKVGMVDAEWKRRAEAAETRVRELEGERDDARNMRDAHYREIQRAQSIIDELAAFRERILTAQVSADWIAVILSEDARVENGSLDNIPFLAVKIAGHAEQRIIAAEAALATERERELEDMRRSIERVLLKCIDRHPGSHQGQDGDWDVGVDVVNIKALWIISSDRQVDSADLSTRVIEPMDARLVGDSDG